MGSTLNHRRQAEECVAMARLAEDNNDRALWLTLAQSWVRLAEHVSRCEASDIPERGERDEQPSEHPAG